MAQPVYLARAADEAGVATEAEMGFVIRVLVNALAIIFAAAILPGIQVDGFGQVADGKVMFLLGAMRP